MGRETIEHPYTQPWERRKNQRGIAEKKVKPTFIMQNPRYSKLIFNILKVALVSPEPKTKNSKIQKYSRPIDLKDPYTVPENHKTFFDLWKRLSMAYREADPQIPKAVDSTVLYSVQRKYTAGAQFLTGSV